jgi:hypothetical protein
MKIYIYKIRDKQRISSIEPGIVDKGIKHENENR